MNSMNLQVRSGSNAPMPGIDAQMTQIRRFPALSLATIRDRGKSPMSRDDLHTVIDD